jgi:hypothetical protein
VQPATIQVNVGHNPLHVVGQVVHLERSSKYLWAVAHVDDGVGAPDYGPAFWSAETDSYRDGTDIELTALALTQFPAQIGLRPLTFLRGALDYRGCTRRWSLERSERELLERAAAGHLERRRREPLLVHDLDAQPPTQRRSLDGRPPGTRSSSAPRSSSTPASRRARSSSSSCPTSRRRPSSTTAASSRRSYPAALSTTSASRPTGSGSTATTT